MIKVNVKTLLSLSILSLNLASGCSTINGRLIAIKSDTEADFSYRSRFIKNGDPIAFFKSECNEDTYRKGRRCWDYRVGSGQVISTGDDVVAVRTQDGLKLSPNIWIEKAFLQN